MSPADLALTAKLLLPFVTQELAALLAHHKQIALDALEAEAIAALALDRAILRAQRLPHAPHPVPAPCSVYDGDVLRDGDST